MVNHAGHVGCVLSPKEGNSPSRGEVMLSDGVRVLLLPKFVFLQLRLNTSSYMHHPFSFPFCDLPVHVIFLLFLIRFLIFFHANF